MKMYDISSSVYEGMAVWENLPEGQPTFTRNTNEHITTTDMNFNLHTGTHIDAPLHMINDGETFETIPLEKLVGHVKVCDLTAVEDGIGREDLEGLDIQANDFVLFKTKNSYHSMDSFDINFIYLKEDGADLLVERGINGVGIDTLGIERSQPKNPTHRKLFNNNIIIVEGLRLKEINPNVYYMVAAPMKLVGTEAAPARVILFDDKPF
ncbi:cyclase family protein [Aquibacillus rhizosphaerae]|uniref:Cyclase family protein n=1 Tax=Aquibacillus rhizosphaerae TaxID=3051431 RepID=A0ABT7L9E3_9BACI|nr:cyclase family protein [Aquibacillus sp. LR5S19]MDL4841805.1 cyclase family protein [Aquibacillus sp. LR5S19]